MQASNKVDKLAEANMLNLPQIVSRLADPPQPEEEVAKVTIAEGLSEIERVKLLLGKKNSTQQQYVFVNAENIFRNESEAQT